MDYSITSLNECQKVTKLALLWLKNANMLSKTNLSIRVPGLDRELFSIEDFARYKGSKVRIELKNDFSEDSQKNFKGFIKNVECDLITLESEKQEIKLQFSAINKASIIPDWEAIMKKARISKKK
jgi:ribosome maturation factor RimP